MIILSFFSLVISIIYKFFILLFTYYILSSIKIILIVYGSYLFYCLYYIYPIHQRLTLSGLRKWKYRFPLEYQLNTTKDHMINIGVLVIYVLIFILGIVILRFYNSNRVVDLKVYYHTLCYIITITPISSLILNVLLLIVLILLLKNLMSIINKYVRHQLIVRHLYTYSNDFYNTLLFNIYILPDIIFVLMTQTRLTFHFFNLRKYPSFLPFPLNEYNYLGYTTRKTSSLYDTPFEKVIMKFLRYFDKIIPTIHRRLLFIIVVYDLLFNDTVLTHMYKILPYVFLYEIWIKIKRFADERIYGLSDPDLIINGILYESVSESMGDFVINGKYYEKQFIADIIVYYVYNDFRWISNDNQKKEKDISLIQKAKMLYGKLQKQLKVYAKYRLIIIPIFLLIFIILNNVLS